jgi:hypothetical protein
MIQLRRAVEKSAEQTRFSKTTQILLRVSLPKIRRMYTLPRNEIESLENGKKVDYQPRDIAYQNNGLLT